MPAVVLFSTHKSKSLPLSPPVIVRVVSTPLQVKYVTEHAFNELCVYS